MKQKTELVLRLVIGAVLVWAGVGKLLQPAAFYSALTDYRVPLPEVVWQFVAVGLPWLEMICGAGLVVDFWPETVRPLVVGMFGVFVGMLLQAVVRGLDLECGCFGGGGGWFERPGVALARAAVLLGLALVLTRAGSAGGARCP